MANNNKFNYYNTLINFCDNLTQADILIEEISEDETISHAEYCELYNKLLLKYQKFNAELKPGTVALYPYGI